MLLSEAKDILAKHGYICESEIRGDYIKGEKGNENFLGLSNDYTKEDAMRYFASAIIGEEKAKDAEKVQTWFNSNLSTASQRARFNKTWETFEKFRTEGQGVLYRGIILNKNTEVDDNKPGVCWSYSRSMPRKWIESIWEHMVEKHVMTGAELNDYKKIIFTAKVNLNDMDLPYSFWLAGRFERNECEVRLRSEENVHIISSKKI